MAEQPTPQPLTIEAILMDIQANMAAMQQKAAQTDNNMARLNDLINTRLPPPLEEEDEVDEAHQEQPIFIPDPNHEGRLIMVHPNPREVRTKPAL
jgi:hypothetical protein